MSVFLIRNARQKLDQVLLAVGMRVEARLLVPVWHLELLISSNFFADLTDTGLDGCADFERLQADGAILDLGQGSAIETLP